jgi:uncharacterized membrane protein
MIIHAPITEVYDLLSNPENYPRFSDIFAEARELADDHYQKVLLLPGGLKVFFDELITRRIPNKLVASRSGPDSQIKFTKEARFKSLQSNRTKVQFWLRYYPPAGIIGHTAAKLFGYDPQALLEDLLQRAKLFLETGRQPEDATDHATPERPPVKSVGI